MAPSKITYKIPLLILTMTFLLLVNCVSATGGIATSNEPMNGRHYKVLGQAETTVTWWAFNAGIVGFALNEPPVDEAEKRLLDEKKGDALINLRYWNDQSVVLFMTYHRFHLKADVIKFNGKGK